MPGMISLVVGANDNAAFSWTRSGGPMISQRSLGPCSVRASDVPALTRAELQPHFLAPFTFLASELIASIPRIPFAFLCFPSAFARLCVCSQND